MGGYVALLSGVNMKVYQGDPNVFRKPRHNMPSKIVRKDAYFCEDGPFKGHLLYLTDGTTMVFSASNQTGRYVNGQWQSC